MPEVFLAASPLVASAYGQRRVGLRPTPKIPAAREKNLWYPGYCTPNNLPNEPDCLYPLESWGIWISGNSCLWNAESITFLLTESRILGCGIQNTTQGTVIPLTIGIWNLSSTDKEAGIQYWNLESVLDCFTWGKNHYAIKPDNMQLYNSVL